MPFAVVLLCVYAASLCICAFQSFSHPWIFPLCRRSRLRASSRLRRRHKNNKIRAAAADAALRVPPEEIVPHLCMRFRLGGSVNCSFVAVAACTCASLLTSSVVGLHMQAHKQQAQQEKEQQKAIKA